MMRSLILILTIFFLTAGTAVAQDSDSRRERENRDRIERLERQVRQVQERVYPDGRPASTAGYYDEPVATRSSVDILTGRVDTLERQMTDIVRSSQEAEYRLGQMEAEIARLRAQVEALTNAPPPPPQPRVEERIPVEPDGGNGSGAEPLKEEEEAAEATPSQAEPTPAPVMAASDPAYEQAGEDAYTEGYRLWNEGQNKAAVPVLRAMISGFPEHRRVSFARNLIGRALLDDGQPRAAAEALLANYRADPEGERAADSLYFLGQALVALGQPGQACRAYDELAQVYGGTMRDYLAERLPRAMAEAGCS